MQGYYSSISLNTSLIKSTKIFIKIILLFLIKFLKLKSTFFQNYFGNSSEPKTPQSVVAIKNRK